MVGRDNSRNRISNFLSDFGGHREFFIFTDLYLFDSCFVFDSMTTQVLYFDEIQNSTMDRYEIYSFRAGKSFDPLVIGMSVVLNN